MQGSASQSVFWILICIARKVHGFRKIRIVKVRPRFRYRCDAELQAVPSCVPSEDAAMHDSGAHTLFQPKARKSLW